MNLAALETRVLVIAPTRVDAEVTSRVMEDAGMSVAICETTLELLREILRGAGAVILTDDVARTDTLAELRLLLDRQPSWSELPIVVLARPDSQRLTIWRTVPGLLLLERPVHVRSMVSAVQAALRARLRQYELRNQLEQTRAANLELQSAAQAKDEFLATLSHELRNPLSALKTAASLLDREGLDPTMDRNARQVVGRQAALMGRLLDDLLDVARITRGRLEIRVVRTKLSSIVRSAVESVHPLLTRKDHRFELKLPEVDIEVDADPVRLSQVLANLLTNAAKYTESGGRISLEVKLEPGAAYFHVCDNGIGIAPEAASDIFGMFAQLRPAIEKSEGGLGIGLALARGLVELHGGTISMKSEGIGKGSEFVVRIPAGNVVPAGTISEPQTNESGPARDKCDLIVADDNVDAAVSLGMLLEMEGHSVRVAHDGMAALALMQERAPDAMLLDIGMPIMNGYEVAQQVRATGSKITLIALTGWGQPADRVRTHDAGFDHHLTKPVEFDELERLLNRDCAADDAATLRKTANT